MSESGDWKQYAYKNDTEEKRIVGKMKILLVDDERTEREGIRFLIEKFQFELEVAEAANGKLAMEYLQKYQDVDILLTDVKMHINI